MPCAHMALKTCGGSVAASERRAFPSCPHTHTYMHFDMDIQQRAQKRTRKHETRTHFVALNPPYTHYTDSPLPVARFDHTLAPVTAYHVSPCLGTQRLPRIAHALRDACTCRCMHSCKFYICVHGQVVGRSGQCRTDSAAVRGYEHMQALRLCFVFFCT